jgi:hypothetical protein
MDFDVVAAIMTLRSHSDRIRYLMRSDKDTDDGGQRGGMMRVAERPLASASAGSSSGSSPGRRAASIDVPAPGCRRDRQAVQCPALVRRQTRNRAEIIELEGGRNAVCEKLAVATDFACKKRRLP